MADRSSAGTTEVEARDRAIVERVAAGLSLRAVGAEYGLSTPIRKYGDAFFGHCQGHEALCDRSLAMST
jgi:hypothetical protein